MRTALTLVAALFLAACSGDDDGGTAGSSSGATTACAADTRKDVYTPGLTKTAAELELGLVDSAFTPSDRPAQPGQVQKGMNAITVEVRDGSKAPVDGASVTLNLWMPDHGHGSARTPKVTPMGGGKYQIEEIWLPMAGLWRFTVAVTTSGAPTPKSADFNFCIDG